LSEPHKHSIFETKLGWMAIQVSNKGVTRTCLPMETIDQCVSVMDHWETRSIQDRSYLKNEIEKIQSYLDGETVDLKSIIIDTSDVGLFLETAWHQCRNIPPGETRTYKWLASKCGNHKASRSAGMAMSRNRLPLLVPCHRVIGSDGSLKGFGGANSRLDLKSWLLDLEQHTKY